ncbi:MAG TPA: DUF1329 domain-containing protein, partial [Candidatus Binataceae bacterium]|nr:DUF1329 domain-containing protein [Candidatus Binataceae bacterium]
MCIAVSDFSDGYFDRMTMRTIVRAAVLAIVAASTIARAQATPAIPAHPAATAAAASAPVSLKPGTIIDASNADRYSNFIPAAAMLAIKHGLRLEVTPTHRIVWSAGFATATEKYSPQVGLDKDDYITNYIAGMPFPLIDVSDPKAAVKVAYNWHFGPVLPDDFSLAPWTVNGYLAQPHDPTEIHPSNDLDNACEQFDFLRYAHRTEVEPRPTLGSNSLGVEWKARCNQWTTLSMGGDTGEGAGIWIRYSNPRTADDFYGFDEHSRRLRRMGIRMAFPNKVCRRCHQPYWAYALPKTEIYKYRLLGTAPILACVSSRDEPAGITEEESGYALTQEPFELRRAYILEMSPIQSDLQERTLIFIDSEIYVWLAAEFYESGELVATAIPLWHTHTSPEGGNLFDLAGSFYFPSDHRGLFRSVVPA